MASLDPITWCVLLMLVGCALAASEIFIPSGGILGTLATIAVMASVILAFYHRGPAVGFGFAFTAVVMLPAAIALALKYWPHTPMGRRFLLGLPTAEEVLPDNDRRRTLKELVGRVGTAKTVMLPSGAISIDGRTIDAVSAGMPIEAGQSVKVVEVRGNRVVVRLMEGDENAVRSDADSLLSKPVEELGLDGLDEPLS